MFILSYPEERNVSRHDIDVWQVCAELGYGTDTNKPTILSHHPDTLLLTASTAINSVLPTNSRVIMSLDTQTIASCTLCDPGALQSTSGSIVPVPANDRPCRGNIAFLFFYENKRRSP